MDKETQLEALAQQTIELARQIYGPNAEAEMAKAGIPIPAANTSQGEQTTPMQEVQSVPIWSVPVREAQPSTSQAGQSAPKLSETKLSDNSVKPFMLRFDPSLVGTPWDDLPNHVEGQDPFWTTSGNRHLFVDPGAVVRSEKVLAYWSGKASPCTAYFLDEGFLRINPRIPAEYKFVWRPDYDPFKPEKGKSFLKYHIPLKKKLKN